MEKSKNIAILGSTGSIGKQALDVIRQQNEKFTVEVLTSFNNWELLVKQAREFIPNAIVIGDERHVVEVKNALSDLPVKVFSGPAAIAEIVQMDTIDMVLTAL